MTAGEDKRWQSVDENDTNMQPLQPVDHNDASSPSTTTDDEILKHNTDTDAEMQPNQKPDEKADAEATIPIIKELTKTVNKRTKANNKQKQTKNNLTKGHAQSTSNVGKVRHIHI